MSVEIRVPDIGDFENVVVIEVHVQPGQLLEAEAPLITLESDKATMEVPAPNGGRITEVRIKAGDKVSQGALIAMMEVDAAADTPIPAAVRSAASLSSTPEVATLDRDADIVCQVVVLGAGPGGYSAAFRAADLGLDTVIVERNPTLGGVCLNVGCIPSKALLHTAAIIDEAAALAGHGISFGPPRIALDALRSHKDRVVGRLTGGLAAMAKARKVNVFCGTGRFLDHRHMEVALSDGSGSKTIRFEKAIIAAGSEAMKLPFIPDDPRIVDSSGALELRQIPAKMLVIGGGIIGLEMATVYSTLGSRIDVVERLTGLMPGADRDLVKVWEKKNTPRFDRVMLGTETVSVEAKKDGVYVCFEGTGAPDGAQRYDMVLVAVGRTSNGCWIGAENAGVIVADRGFINVDRQMRTNVAHIFAIGDLVGQPMLAHKAVHEGHVAAEAAAGVKSSFDARQIPSVAYTDPEIAWAGLTEEQAVAKGVKFRKAVFPWVASGRAIANGRDEGFTKLLFDEDTHRIVGGGIVGTHAGDLISEICLAIEMGCEPHDIGKTIHPHPTLGESIGMAAEVFEGTCTDLPPLRKQAR
ncbi:dihydrolipoyl dehydrogenase [Bradyrhizobium sp. BR13661]|jgi:dihydrolipoamide dehydrogenase|uniref:dihydrolipoyl dehydrogenase n=1 Tax=Bradyrhizobium sp. BR13661 TaxID=2940622 RepID=UPI0024748B20|nr:dihydrolipoyl dehydrogenase [Bradyrhizobium sp. BR13661]MDH6257576.1 dihydrolipoamide dehydrogenase [Bradyrhizobium sp. BR13661]